MVMAVITEILSVVRVDGDQPYYITTALVNGDEYTGWSEAEKFYEVGDNVQIFYDDRYDKPKMKKGIDAK